MNEENKRSWKEPEFRTCQYCKCKTNARIRACCDKGRSEDLRSALKASGTSLVQNDSGGE